VNNVATGQVQGLKLELLFPFESNQIFVCFFASATNVFFDPIVVITSVFPISIQPEPQDLFGFRNT
jgi:hypothetical protein